MTQIPVPERESLPSESMRSILDGLSEGVIVAGPDGRLIEFNSSAERVLGIELEEIGPAEWTSACGCYMVDKVTPWRREELPLIRAMRGETTGDELIYIRNPMRPEGLWIIASGRPLRGPSDELAGGIVTFRDASDQMRAIEGVQQGWLSPSATVPPSPNWSLDELSAYFTKFRQSYDLLASVVMQTADSILITDPSGAIEFVNPGFERTTGYSWHEAIGQNPRILQSGHHDRQFYAQMWGQISRGGHFRGTILNRRKDGDLFWSEQTISPVRDAEGNILQYVSVLKDITALREKHEQDVQLQIAQRVQQGLYPRPISVPGLDIHGAVMPADQTGGDYFDIIVSDGYVWIAIGDVSGHGLGPALIMASTRAFVRSFLRSSADLGEVLCSVNRELMAEVQEEFFVALCLVRLRPSERSIVFANAGHFPGFMMDSAGQVQHELRNTGMPLGIQADVEIGCSEEICLVPGGLAIFFTDGIMEAIDKDENEFGLSRALDVVAEHRHESAERIVGRVLDAVRSFVGDQPQSDDLTCLIVKANPID